MVSDAFSLEHPVIILSELETDSGQNDQKGFMQIFKGAFQGIRNPRAHSLANDLNEHKAAQYLVFASLLARRLDEAKIVKGEAKEAVQAKVTRKQTPTQRVESRPTQSDGLRLSQSLPPKIVNDAVVLLDWIQKNHNAYIQSYPSFATIRPYLTILQQDGFIRESDVSNMDGTVFELTGLGQKTLCSWHTARVVSAPPNFLLPPSPVVDPNQSRFSVCIGSVATHRQFSGLATNPRTTGLRCMYFSFSTSFCWPHRLKS